MRIECRLCGSGGQGIILAGIILAEAAGIHEGREVAQVQDYGPAARGDSSKTDVVISDSEIDYPKCSRLDVLVALSQRAYGENRASLKEGGVLIVDSDNVTIAKSEGGLQFPMTEIARDAAGTPVGVNMVALGVLAAVGGVVKLSSVKNAMLARVPAHTRNQNLAALMAGYEEAKSGLKGETGKRKKGEKKTTKTEARR